ncbi:Hypothetical predicted protein [Paramuricea clavata]|uniref:Uncharacterized protein n=1 Tax=Paramuricea clavata TaxID=317549 RepID=A0A6S7KI20_PARCT|nr:Hypothetical predicted protein [Paramuricea clavata]
MQRVLGETKLLCGDLVVPLESYYIYCYAYEIRFLGQRIISVAVIDLKHHSYTTAQIYLGIYPDKFTSTDEENYIVTSGQRTIVSIQRCTTLAPLRWSSTHVKPIVQQRLDEVVQYVLNYNHFHEIGIQRRISRGLGVHADLRLIQLLSYAQKLQNIVKNYCQSNCTCGGFNDECTCPIPYRCDEVFLDAKQLYDHAVLFRATCPAGEETL